MLEVYIIGYFVVLGLFLYKTMDDYQPTISHHILDVVLDFILVGFWPLLLLASLVLNIKKYLEDKKLLKFK